MKRLFLRFYVSALLALLLLAGGMATLISPDFAPPTPQAEAPQVEPPPMRWRVTALLGWLSLTALALYLPLRSVSHQLTDLADATIQLRGGDLDARAVLGSNGPVRDVAEQFNSMADRLQSLLSSHEDLLRSTSHELRTPVSRLFFSLDLLRGEENPKEREALADEMETTLVEVRDLTSELLEYARLGDIGPHRPFYRVDLLEIVVAQRSHQEVPIDLVGSSVVVPCDKRLLERCIDNLLANAARYGNGTVRVTVRSTDRHAELAVEDDGPGIPLAARSRVFEPFVRLEHSRSRDTGGVGLGLTIVQRVATHHGGTCHVESGDLGGARFLLRLPIVV